MSGTLAGKEIDENDGRCDKHFLGGPGAEKSRFDENGRDRLDVDLFEASASARVTYRGAKDTDDKCSSEWNGLKKAVGGELLCDQS